MCAKLLQVSDICIETVEGIDYTKEVPSTENVVEKWQSSNSNKRFSKIKSLSSSIFL